MNERTPESDVRIERYLDGVMTDAERDAFEQDCERDPSLAHRLAAAKADAAAIEASLEAHFAPPQLSALADRVRAAAALRESSPAHATASYNIGTVGSPPTARTASRWMWSSIAAALLLVGLAILGVQRAQSMALQRGTQLAAYYADQVSIGLTPQWVCKDEPTFREYTKMRFGVELTFRDLGPGVALIGWTYVRGPMRTDTNAVLMATAPADVASSPAPILVIVEKRGDAPRVSRPEGTSLHIHRRDLGRVSLYEVSPLEKPVVLESIHEAK